MPSGIAINGSGPTNHMFYGNPHPCIFDAPLTELLGHRTAKVSAWYDNE
jgi:glyceraldehyde-3-phosphate dehydrogenase/erythrose-4-phosphate dehydrogenase